MKTIAECADRLVKKLGEHNITIKTFDMNLFVERCWIVLNDNKYYISEIEICEARHNEIEITVLFKYGMIVEVKRFHDIDNIFT